MADPISQGSANVTFTRNQTSSTTASLPVALVNSISGSTVISEIWMTLDPTNTVPAQSTFNVTGTASPGDTASATFTDADGNAAKYVAEALTGWTTAKTVQHLVDLLNVDDDVIATVAATTATVGTIAVTSARPGRTFSLTTSGTGFTVSSPVSVTTGSKIGSTYYRKVGQIESAFGPTTDGQGAQVQSTTKWYDGATSPTQVQVLPGAIYRHPSLVSQIQAAQGV